MIFIRQFNQLINEKKVDYYLMESELLGIEKDYQNIYISKILEFGNINDLEDIVAIYEVTMPLYLSSSIYDDCLLILCKEELTILCLNELTKMTKIKYSNMKAIIMSTIVNEIILSYQNYSQAKNQLLLKCEKNIEIIKSISSFYSTIKNAKMKIIKCKFSNLNEKRNLDYINLTHGNIITSVLNRERNPRYTIKDYKFIKLLWEAKGRKVLLAQNTITQKYSAIKVLHKYHLVNQGKIYLYIEKFILENFNNTFLLQDEFTFQSEKNIYIVSPYIKDDLFTLLQSQGRFNEDIAKFISVCIGLGLQALHDYKIAYRDLKPENILIGDDGFAILCDFGLSVLLYPSNKAYSLCGTPHYFAPEMIVNNSHDQRVDWWGFGIFLYEMLCGVAPFYDTNNHSLYEKIINSTVNYPDYLSKEAINLINSLLQKDPDKRLGRKNGFEEIMQMDFYRNVDIERIKEKKIVSPLLKIIKEKNVNIEETSTFNLIESELFAPEQNEQEVLERYKEAFSDFD